MRCGRASTRFGADGGWQGQRRGRACAQMSMSRRSSSVAGSPPSASRNAVDRRNPGSRRGRTLWLEGVDCPRHQQEGEERNQEELPGGGEETGRISSCTADEMLHICGCHPQSTAPSHRSCTTPSCALPALWVGGTWSKGRPPWASPQGEADRQLLFFAPTAVGHY